MYAERKQLPLKQVTVSLNHSREHVTDCADCGSAGKHLDLIHRTIHLHGDLTDQQRTRMMEIADRCPVHRTLKQGPLIKSELGD